jgi:hypothetical protein
MLPPLTATITSRRYSNGCFGKAVGHVIVVIRVGNLDSDVDPAGGDSAMRLIIHLSPHGSFLLPSSEIVVAQHHYGTVGATTYIGGQERESVQVSRPTHCTSTTNC